MVGALKSLSFVAVALLLASCSTAPLEGSSGPMYPRRSGSGWEAAWQKEAPGRTWLYLWAVRDLRIAESTGPGEKAKYSAAIAELEVIEHMPDAVGAARENAESGPHNPPWTASSRCRRVPRTMSSAIP